MPTNTRNSDDMGMPPTNNWKRGNCGYIGACYGTPTDKGISAPWCNRCGMNNKLERIYNQP